MVARAHPRAFTDGPLEAQSPWSGGETWAMSWVKLSDDAFRDQAMLAAGPDGFLVYLEILTWCSHNLTDGFIPDYAALGLVTPSWFPHLTRVEILDKLVRAELLTRVGDGLAEGEVVEQTVVERGRGHAKKKRAPVTVRIMEPGYFAPRYLRDNPAKGEPPGNWPYSTPEASPEAGAEASTDTSVPVPVPVPVPVEHHQPPAPTGAGVQAHDDAPNLDATDELRATRNAPTAPVTSSERRDTHANGNPPREGSACDHEDEWRARDDAWRCVVCAPPSWNGEVRERRTKDAGR